jgi:hypothetical protein
LIHSESASWSGAAGSGWVEADFSAAPSLSTGTKYVPCIFKAGTTGNWYSAEHDYWDGTGPGAGGITSSGGHLSAPNSATSVNGQGVFSGNPALSFPNSTFLATNYWVDPVFTPGTAQTGTAALTVTPVFTAAPAVARVVSAALTVTPVFTVAATGPGSGTGSTVLAVMASIRRRRRR